MATDLLGHGVYSVSEASRLTGVSSRRIRAWFDTGWSQLGPVHRGDYAQEARSVEVLSFLDLIDTQVMGCFRSLGVSLQYLRNAHNALREALRTDHPFCKQTLLTDGRQVFLDAPDTQGERVLKEVLSSQMAFREFLIPYLKGIQYETRSLLAARWYIEEGVVIDPARRFGKPIIDRVGVPTAVLAAALDANEHDAERVADWYDVTPDEVLGASAFERSLLREVA